MNYYETFNENSILGKNQYLHDVNPEFYSDGELPAPPVHHQNLNATDRHNIYPDVYPDPFVNPEGCKTVIPPTPVEEVTEGDGTTDPEKGTDDTTE